MYFATDFLKCRTQFRNLDAWIRMRLRCMKKKRKSYRDNQRIKNRYFHNKLGLLNLEQFCLAV